jgi:ubiquinone/menaquinone biosynthesis C-methylase UbiE
MKNRINYEEENRMKSNNARKVEFIVTTLLLEDLLKGNLNILDCAAGTGVYSLFLANIGHYVTTLDITKKHIEIINQKLEGKKYNVETAVNEARGLEMFDDESFDVVLCMGPLYHLTEEIDRNLCFEECYRVLKKGGLLISSYTSRFSVIPNLVTKNFPLPKNNLIKELWSNGTLSYDDYLYLGAEIYYHTPCEMEELYDSYELKLIDHLGVDGTSLLLANSIDQMNDEEFDIWLDYHLSVCREKSIIGISSHGLLIGEK